MASIETIRGILEMGLAPSELVISDDSHLHSGHYSHSSVDPSHLRIKVVSSAFDGVSRVKQHQMVNRLLKGAFDEGLHALALETKVSN